MNIKRSVSKALGAALLALAAITPMSAANAAVAPDIKHVTVEEAPIILAQYGYQYNYQYRSSYRAPRPNRNSYQYEYQWRNTPYGTQYNYQYRYNNRYNNCNPYRTF
jgi:opacity protein-like surface antigen